MKLSNSEIMARVLKQHGAATGLEPLLEEFDKLERLGDFPRAEQVGRTIEDLCGFYENGVFYGAAEIYAAATDTRDRARAARRVGR